MSLSSCVYQKCHRHLRESSFLSRGNAHSSLVALSLTLLTVFPQLSFTLLSFSRSLGFLFLPFYFSLRHQSSSHLFPCPFYTFCSPLTQFPALLHFSVFHSACSFPQYSSLQNRAKISSLELDTSHLHMWLFLILTVLPLVLGESGL